MKVKNLNGTTKHTCDECGSWLTHWEKLSQQTADKCAYKGCSNDATLGAHVQKETDDDSWYIIPLCDTCNKIDSKNAFEIKKHIPPVSAVKC